LTSVIFL